MTLQFNFTSSNAGSRANNLEVIEILRNHFENEENEFKEFFEDGTISFEKTNEMLCVYGDSSYHALTRHLREEGDFEIKLAKAIKKKIVELHLENHGGNFQMQILGFSYWYNEL